jgi:hypothetical protein
MNKERSLYLMPEVSVFLIDVENNLLNATVDAGSGEGTGEWGNGGNSAKIDKTWDRSWPKGYSTP